MRQGRRPRCGGWRGGLPAQCPFPVLRGEAARLSGGARLWGLPGSFAAGSGPLRMKDLWRGFVRLRTGRMQPLSTLHRRAQEGALGWARRAQAPGRWGPLRVPGGFREIRIGTPAPGGARPFRFSGIGNCGNLSSDTRVAQGRLRLKARGKMCRGHPSACRGEMVRSESADKVRRGPGSRPLWHAPMLPCGNGCPAGAIFALRDQCRAGAYGWGLGQDHDAPGVVCRGSTPGLGCRSGCRCAGRAGRSHAAFEPVGFGGKSRAYLSPVRCRSPIGPEPYKAGTRRRIMLVFADAGIVRSRARAWPVENAGAFCHPRVSEHVPSALRGRG